MPIGWVDLAGWLTNLTSGEYRRLAPRAHIAAGTSPTEEGERISIHVEMIGGSLLVHQYVGELIGRRSCRLDSVSTCLRRSDRPPCTLCGSGVEPLDEQSCEYVNRLTAIATAELIAFIDAQGIDVVAAAAAYAEALEAHNELETASLAASIEPRAHASGEPRFRDLPMRFSRVTREPRCSASRG